MRLKTRLKRLGEALRIGSLTGKIRLLNIKSFIKFCVAGRVYLKFHTVWVLLTFLDSQLKSFADKNNIPVPQPRARDTLLQKVRSNYESAAKKAGETAAYPGNWLYQTWSESGGFLLAFLNNIY
jgi:hypothetical protein